MRNMCYELLLKNRIKRAMKDLEKAYDAMDNVLVFFEDLEESEDEE